MSWTAADIPDQTDRVAVVTGANAGLGLEIATRLAEHGATVVLACRNAARAATAAETIRAGVPGARVAPASLDLADLRSVDEFADHFAADHARLNLLINNAGLMAVDRSRTADGFETQFGVNHLGHAALTGRLLPLLEATPGSRVATMSSVGHRAGRIAFDDLMGDGGYGRWRAYFQSKLANLLFSAELQRQLGERGSATIAVAAHPGFSRTDLGKDGASVANRAMRTLVPHLTQPVGLGALPMLYAATASEVRGGEFYGPRFIGAGHPVREISSRRARRADDAARLWDVTAELLAGARARREPAAAA